MDNDLIKLLENTGFTEKEARVYLALLELGKGDVSDIAKIAGLKRSIIYVILEGLMKRGYTSELPNMKINTYRAADPSVILNQLKTTTRNFSEMISMLKMLGNKGAIKPKIIYHDTKDGMMSVYNQISYSKAPFFISSYVRLKKLFPGAVERWISDRKKGKFKFIGKNLIPNTLEEVAIGKELAQVEDQEIRSLDELNNINMDFTLFDNKLAISSLEDEPFIVVIESESLVSSIRPIFEIAWRSGKEIR